MEGIEVLLSSLAFLSSLLQAIRARSENKIGGKHTDLEGVVVGVGEGVGALPGVSAVGLNAVAVPLGGLAVEGIGVFGNAAKEEDIA
jgi:hypothetical protein